VGAAVLILCEQAAEYCTGIRIMMQLTFPATSACLVAAACAKVLCPMCPNCSRMPMPCTCCRFCLLHK
jgi:hypothetical protein